MTGCSKVPDPWTVKLARGHLQMGRLDFGYLGQINAVADQIELQSVMIEVVGSRARDHTACGLQMDVFQLHRAIGKNNIRGQQLDGTAVGLAFAQRQLSVPVRISKSPHSLQREIQFPRHGIIPSRCSLQGRSITVMNCCLYLEVGVVGEAAVRQRCRSIHR